MPLCLLSGYVWLGIAGVFGSVGAFQLGYIWRDAALHALLLSFVFAMVFGHAPIILPALARLKPLLAQVQAHYGTCVTIEYKEKAPGAIMIDFKRV